MKRETNIEKGERIHRDLAARFKAIVDLEAQGLEAPTNDHGNIGSIRPIGSIHMPGVIRFLLPGGGSIFEDRIRSLVPTLALSKEAP